MNSEETHNPFAFEHRPWYRRRVEPHRGTLILTLGIMSLATLGMVAPVACVMGWNDLRKMRAGRMDGLGRTKTQVGTALGVTAATLVLLVLVTITLSLVVGFILFLWRVGPILLILYFGNTNC